LKASKRGFGGEKILTFGGGLHFNIRLHSVGTEESYYIEMLRIERVTKKAGFKHPFVLSATKYLKEGVHTQEHAHYIREFVAKEKIAQALFNMHAGNNKEAQNILKECETEEFKLQKERSTGYYAYSQHPYTAK